MMRNLSIGMALALVVAATASAQPASSQPAGDPRWEPWLGCWQLLDESVRSKTDLAAEEVAQGIPAARKQRAAAGARVCVTPAGKGVTLTTAVGSQKALEETIVADGVAQPMTDAECRGNKRSEWSALGPRLYTTADLSCGTQPARKVSSLTMLTPGPTWVDIQLIDINGRKNIRIRKYERTADQPQLPRMSSTAPIVGDSAWTIADVKEASAKLMPEAVQAAIVELGKRFDLNKKQLVDLDNAGVSDDVIDLMVALSYPKHFVVERPVSTAPPPYGFVGNLGYPVDWMDFGMMPYWSDLGMMSSYYYGSAFWPSYYSPFAYRYWGYYDPYYQPNSGYVVIGTPGTGVTPGTTSGSGEGRVVDGRGYTRVTTRVPEPVNTNGHIASGSNGTMSSGSSSSGSSSGGSSGVSSGGYSSGGSGGGGGDSGRTAVPRPPGGLR